MTTDRTAHIRVPMTIHANDYNLCGAPPGNVDLPLREARRTPLVVLETSIWNICQECLEKMQEQR